MAIVEIDNPRREKNGEEIFELITQRPVQNELGNAYRAILKLAYEYSIKKNPYFQIQILNSTTWTAIVMLTVLHQLLENRRGPNLQKEYKLTNKGKRVYKLLFLEPPPTLH